MSALGFASTLATGFIGDALFTPLSSNRSIGEFTSQVTIEERHMDELEVTDHPVDQGATISDHAFKKPASLMIKAQWADSEADDIESIYSKLLQLQSGVTLMSIVTGKRIYNNMLIVALAVDTDKLKENILDVTMNCREVIRVSSHSVSVSAAAADQVDPHSTMPILDSGQQQLQAPQSFNPDAVPEDIAVASEASPTSFTSLSDVPANVSEVPLASVGQTFQIALNNIPYAITSKFNQYAGWVMDIANVAGIPLVGGVPLVTGSDLLGQLTHLGIGGQLFVQTDNDADALPTADNLGSSSHLYFAANS